MCAEVLRIFNKAPIHILLITLIDLTCALIWASNPYIIGVCIDDLLERKYCWLFIFISLQLVLIALRTVDKFLDTRVSSKIIEEESIAYYEKIIRTHADESKIISLLALVDEVPNFLEVNLFEIISMFGGIVISLWFIFCELDSFVFILAISVSIIVPIATYRLQKNISLNYKKLKDIDEKRVNTIASRKITRYKKHIKDSLALGITNSDLDAKIYLITDLLQTTILVIAILSTIHAGNYTSGQLFSTITYVMMLNEYVGEINGNILLIKDLNDTVARLERNTK